MYTPSSQIGNLILKILPAHWFIKEVATLKDGLNVKGKI